VTNLRVHAGTLAAKSSFVVARTGKTERVGDLYAVQGKELRAVPSAAAGDLVAVTKVEDVRVGDTVTDGRVALTFAPIAFPRPVVSLAVVPKSHADDAKLLPDSTACRGRPPSSRSATRPPASSGPRDEPAASRRRSTASRTQVEVTTHAPRIAYRETVGRSARRVPPQEAVRRPRPVRQVHMRVEPLARGEGFEFVDAVVGGTIRGSSSGGREGVRDALGRASSPASP
jgi:elongation factor G